MPDEIDSRRDWAFGNPLTFNDLNSQVYGKARFGHNEGLMHALALEQRRRAKAPPALAAA